MLEKSIGKKPKIVKVLSIFVLLFFQTQRESFAGVAVFTTIASRLVSYSSKGAKFLHASWTSEKLALSVESTIASTRSALKTVNAVMSEGRVAAIALMGTWVKNAEGATKMIAACNKLSTVLKNTSSNADTIRKGLTEFTVAAREAGVPHSARFINGLIKANKNDLARSFLGNWESFLTTMKLAPKF